MSDARLYWLTNLILSAEIARIYDLKESAAIRRCAKRMRDETKSDSLYELAKLILKAPGHKVQGMVKNLEKDLKNEGLYHVG